MTRQIAVWDPFRGWSNEVFDRPFRGWMNSFNDEMAVDVSETDDKVMIKLSAPGFNKDNIDINIEDNLLTVSGRIEEKSEDEDKQTKYYRREISVKSFSQSIQLPTKVEAEGAKATFKDGFLHVDLPKAPEVKPRKISVDVN